MPDPSPLSPHAQLAERFLRHHAEASSPVVSPDGQWVAFVVTRVEMDRNSYRSQVWVAATDGSTPPRPVSAGEHDGDPTWSPDGATLLFTGRRSPKKTEATLHALPFGTPGEVRTIATMRDGVAGPRVSPDGRWVAFGSRTPDPRYLVEGADEGDTSWQPPRRIERFFTRLNGEGWVFDRPAHVYVAPLDGTAAPRNLTPGAHQHSGVEWLPDSSGVVTSAPRHDTWDRDLAVDLHVVGLDGTVTALTHRTGIYFDGAPGPDGGSIALLGLDDSNVYPQNVRVGVLTPGQPHRWITGSFDRTFETTGGSMPPVWIDDHTLLAVAEDRGRTHVMRLHTDGREPVPVTSGPITVSRVHAAGGTVCCTAASVDALTDVFVVEVDGSLRRLTDFAARYRAQVPLLGWERFTAPCTDGSDEIDAWIMRPADFDPTRTYPVLLNVHGGPHTQYGETFFDEAQMQAAAGFVVLMSNPRGGSGRHEGWGQAILGRHHTVRPGTGWGSVDVDDVMAVLDTALARFPFCDRDRVGMLGGSYGGYMATTLAGRFSHRFRGICSERSVNDAYLEEFTSDISTMFRAEHGPTFVENPEAYHEVSPIRHVRDITCPMLIIHSEDDLRCPVSQAEQLFVMLRLLDRDVTFYRFPGETHELSRSGSPVHRRQRAEIILDWFAERCA